MNDPTTEAYMDHYHEPQPDPGDEVRRYWRILLRRRWVLITTLVVTTITALVYSRYQVPTYRAATTLIIESKVPGLSELDQSAPVRSSDRFYQSQYEVIRSYAVAQKAFHMLGLGDPGSADDGDHADDSDRIVAFQGRFTVEPVKNSQLARISTTGLDPEKVAERVNALARAYVQHNLEDRHRSSNDAFVWLSERLRILEAQVAKSARDLLAFEAQEDILSLDRRRTLLEERLSGWAEKLTQAAMRRMELETLLNELEHLRRQPEMLEALPQALQNVTVQELKTDYLRAKLELTQLAGKFKPKHPRIVDLESQIGSLKSSLMAEIGKVAKSIEVEYRISQTTEQGVARNLEELKRSSAQLARQAIEYDVLEREARSNRQMYDVMLQRLKETDIGGKITVNNVRIVDPARVPTAPTGPSRARLPYYGVSLGIFFGLLFCWLTDLVDNKLRNEEDVQLYLQAPVIGSVPKEKDGQLGSAHFLRAYRDIKTQIGFYAQEHLLKCLLITSSVPGEGKTTTVVQLGQAFAQSGAKVLLIDADLYRPRLRKIFDIKEEVGLTDIVLSDKEPQSVIVTDVAANLHVLPSGLLPPDPAGVLGSEKIRELFNSLKENFDVVLVESAPLSAGLESAALGTMVDGIVLVVQANKTPRTAVKKATQQLWNSRGNVLGIVLTSVDPAADGLGQYYEPYVHPAGRKGLEIGQ